MRRNTVLAFSNAFQSVTALLTAYFAAFSSFICDDSVINSPEFPVSFFLTSLDHKKSFTLSIEKLLVKFNLNAQMNKVTDM